MNQMHHNDVCEVRGSILNGLISFGKMKWGNDFLNEISIPIKGELRPYAYYPIDWLKEVINTIEKKSTGDKEKVFKQAGSYVIKSSSEGKIFVDYASFRGNIEEMIKKFAFAISQDFFHRCFETQITESERKIDVKISVKDRRGKDLRICWLRQGALSHFIKMSNRNMRYKHPECIADGYEHCLYVIEID